MATLCNLYGSSPCSNSFLFDHIPSGSFDDCFDFGNLKSDTELFEDLNWPSTIQSDIEKMKSESDNASDCSNGPLIGGDNFEMEDIKPEIRNINCMWSDAFLSTSASSTMSDVAQTAVPLAAVSSFNANLAHIKQETDTKQQQQQTTPTIIVAKNISNSMLQFQAQQLQMLSLSVKKEIKMEPVDDYEQQLQQHSIPNSRTAQQNIQKQTQSMQHIPPGTSLLRKSNAIQQQQLKKAQQQQLQQQQQQQKQTSNNTLIQIPKLQTAGFIRLRDQCPMTTATTAGATSNNATMTKVTNNTNSNNGSSNKITSSSYVRPDTPHSLDDDCIEFNHNVDLRACVMGSNNISLPVDPTHYIQHVSQALQDTSKNQIDIGFGSSCDASLAEVLDVISKDYQTKSSKSQTKPATTSVLRAHNADVDSDTESISGNSSYDSGSSIMDADLSYAITSPTSSQGSINGSSHHQSYLHSDHSYTRCKDGMDDVGPSLETPSDSDEEIDVVTIGDKKLPTNPSDKDRRALQNKVAYKISNRMVKTVNGLRTIPPRRSGSVEYPYTPASSNSPVKSLANSRYPSQLLMTVLSDGTTAPINIINDKTRKRVNGNLLINTSNNADYSLPPNKKYRGKKSKNGSVSTTTSLSGTANGALRRHYSLDEAADTIEKRNLHNDMERQRRIGLKNLFEALKKQIPSIKDKERAPKVNILREAAKLCDALVVEDRRVAEQRAILLEQLKKRQEQKMILLEQLRKRHDLKSNLIIHRD